MEDWALRAAPLLCTEFQQRLPHSDQAAAREILITETLRITMRRPAEEPFTSRWLAPSVLAAPSQQTG